MNGHRIVIIMVYTLPLLQTNRPTNTNTETNQKRTCPVTTIKYYQYANIATKEEEVSFRKEDAKTNF